MNGVIPPLDPYNFIVCTENFLYIYLEIFTLQGRYAAWFSN